MTIKVTVSDKRAVVDGTPVIVCGNSGYSIEFTFDEEWNAYTQKTARFRWLQNSAEKHKDVEFTGTTAAVPILFDTSFVMVGVYAGDLCTTTPAKVLCKRSILCGKSEEQISPQEKAGMQAQINDLGDRVGALEKGSTGGTPGNGSGQDIYILGEGETVDDAPAGATIIIDPNAETDEPATQKWVTEQIEQVKQDMPKTDGLASETWVTSQINQAKEQVEQNMPKTDGLASEAWVTSQIQAAVNATWEASY